MPQLRGNEPILGLNIYYNVNPYNPFIFLTIITPNPYKKYETKPYITSNLTNIPSNL
jgi:hypothetical protein